MIEKIMTLEQARNYRYSAWACNPEGVKYNEKKCAAEVWGVWGHWYYSRQCSRKNGHGPDNLYCKQHAKEFKK